MNSIPTSRLGNQRMFGNQTPANQQAAANPVNGGQLDGDQSMSSEQLGGENYDQNMGSQPGMVGGLRRLRGMNNQTRLSFGGIGETTSCSASPLEMISQGQNPVMFKAPEVPQAGISQELRFDDIMEKLLHHGYLVEARVYVGSMVKFLIACTRRGDKVILKLDNELYRMTFPKSEGESDFQIEQRDGGVVIVPQETKVGVLKCLNYDICGAAFVCDENFCVTEKHHEAEAVSFSDEMFVFRKAPEFKYSRLGGKSVAYPVVKLKSVLADPCGLEEKIGAVSAQIHCQAFDRLQVKYENTRDMIKYLLQQLECMNNMVNLADTELDRDIAKLTKVYCDYGQIPMCELCDQDKCIYQTVMKELKHKKMLRNKVINCVSHTYCSLKTVGDISDTIKTSCDPLVQELVECAGLIDLSQ